MLRNHGLEKRDVCRLIGINSRLDTIQAGIAGRKLKELDKWNRRIRSLAGRYSRALREYVEVPVDKPHEKPCYHRYMIRLKGRDKLQTYLAAHGIETKVNYPVPIHLQPAAKCFGYRRGDFPVAEKLADTILSLPLYPEMKDDEINFVIETIKKYFVSRKY
jgi:dTDP-4-amino-4,6-dideoxygalactose transaminase